MRSSEKRVRLIEYLNYRTYKESKPLLPIHIVIDDFKFKYQDVIIPTSTAYRIIRDYIRNHQDRLEMNDKSHQNQ